MSKSRRDQPTPSFLKPKSENSPSIKPYFKPNSESLFEPHQSFQTLDSSSSIHVKETVERYNLIMNYLNKISNESQRAFATHLIVVILPTQTERSLKGLDALL